MLSSRKSATCLAIAWLAAGITAHAAEPDIGCPPTHDGKPLKAVELFDGSPSNKIEVIPEDGRFIVPQTPKELWGRFPASTLGCTYRNSKEMVTVVLPRYVRICEFPHYPQVECH